MKKFLKALTLSLAALVGLVQPAGAQVTSYGGLQVTPFRSLWAQDVITAVNTDVAIYVKYVGTGTQGAGAATVAVDGSGNIAFINNGSADTTVNAAAVCGGTPGTITVATCTTFTAVINEINKSVNWVAVAHTALLADTSTNALNTLSATSAKGPTGVGLLWKTSVQLAVTNILLPVVQAGSPNLATPSVTPGSQLGILNYIGNGIGGQTTRVIRNPFADRDTVLLYAAETVTTTDNVGVNLIRVLCVYPQYNSALSSTQPGISTETVVELFRKALGLTTVQAKADEFLNAGGLICNGGKLLVRANGTTTLTAPQVFATGYVKFKQ